MLVKMQELTTLELSLVAGGAYNAVAEGVRGNFASPADAATHADVRGNLAVRGNLTVRGN